MVNTKPFHRNGRRWRPFQGENVEATLYFQLYVDGFRTWLPRSGNVVGVYMALSQLPLEKLNQTENMNLVSLIPAGVYVMKVLKVISDDIQKLQAGVLDVWFADLSSIQKGRWVKIQPILSFLKGDTPQPASYTSTTGPSGKHFCHGCCANTENFFEKGVLLKQRRSAALSRRIQHLFRQSKSDAASNQIRK